MNMDISIYGNTENTKNELTRTATYYTHFSLEAPNQEALQCRRKENLIL